MSIKKLFNSLVSVIKPEAKPAIVQACVNSIEQPSRIPACRVGGQIVVRIRSLYSDRTQAPYSAWILGWADEFLIATSHDPKALCRWVSDKFPDCFVQLVPQREPEPVID